MLSKAHLLLPNNASLRVHKCFTTSDSLDVDTVHHVQLKDSHLGVHRATSDTTHKLVHPPRYNDADEHVKVWEAFFPRGSINPGHPTAPPGGFGFYMSGPEALARHWQLDTSKEVMIGYEVMFQEDFHWGKGGKLPGIYGGVGDHAYKCTGGRQAGNSKCFNLRLMWRPNGDGELYAYMPITAHNTERLLATPPHSRQNQDYGFSIGRGAWRFLPGRWTAIAQRVKLNTYGETDGEIELFVDGRSVILITGLMFRDESSRFSHVQGIHFQTFFGGHAPDWASPKDQRAWFRSVTGAILRPAIPPRPGHDEL